VSNKVAKLEKPFRNRIVGAGVEQTDQLLANPRNWRVHPDFQQQALAGGIDDIGFIRSVTVNQASGAIVDGHLRVILALRSGVKELPVEYVDLTEEEEAKALLMLDPIAAMASSDRAKLADLMREVNSDDERVQAMLAELAEREGILGNGHEPKDAEPQVDRADELKEQWGTELGQLWCIGDHMLLCGDSTKREDVERVMGGDEANLVMADPPYGINASQMTMGDKESSKPRNARLSRGQKWDSFRPKVIDLLAFAPRVCIWGAQYFCHQLPISDDWLCWHKKIEGVSFCEAELAWTNYGCRLRVLSHHWSGEEKLHITQKPLPVITWAIEICPGTPALIYDPFLGSGTTMVACQNLGRKCRAIEISPAYVAVTLQRMQDAFGITGELVE